MAQIGTDLEQISRIQRVMARTPGFAKRVFTGSEQAYCRARGRPAQHYAVRFCAKEALAKALGIPVHWQEIEVGHDPGGAPVIRTTGQTARVLARRAVRVSLAHAGDYAVATVLIEDKKV